MKGFDIGIQEKKAKLFNEWERFTSTDEESIESYYHHFSKLMNDFKRTKHFLEKIASNLKFLNNLQPEWGRHVTIVHQTKDLHTADYTQLYDSLSTIKRSVSARSTIIKYLHAITTSVHQTKDLHTADYTQLYDFFKYNQKEKLEWANCCSEITNQIPNGNGNVVVARAEGNATRNHGNQIRCYNCRGLGRLLRTTQSETDAAYLQTQLLIAQKKEARIQLQAEEYDLMAAATDLDEIEEVNANCILMANLQQASTTGTQTDKAPIFDSDGSAEVHNYDNCYDNEIFNIFTQEE
nr:hypothetical protein [Tanacetum cinerariifolium]